MPPTPAPPPHLERALLFTIACHALAMVAMAALLLPGMPGQGPDEARVAYVAAHPWRWRLGWLSWGLTAASDLWLAQAMVATPWLHRGLAILGLALTGLAVLPDQWGQFLWMTEGVALARQGDFGAYLALEREAFTLTAVYGATGYTLGALAWSACFAVGGVWNRLLTWLSVVLWSLFAVISAAPLAGVALPPALVAAGNAVGFVLMEAWFALLYVALVRRTPAPTPWFSPA